MPLTNAILIKDKAVIGGGSSGGGHTIQDNSGTNMSQQPTLQFTGDVEVANDEENQKTIVNIPKATEITWDEWQELPDEEKEQGKWNITGAPGVDGTINAELLTKLWENSDITAAFAPQDITILEMLDYNFLLYEVRTDNVNACYITCFAPRTGTTLTYAINTPTGVQTYYRSVRMIEDTSIRFGDTYTSIGSAAKSINNTLLIPYRIYGLKTAIDLKISAIASDVSTSASKCMMSDGTSVEEKVTANVLTERTTITAYTSTSGNYYECPSDGYILCNSSNSDSSYAHAIIYDANKNLLTYVTARTSKGNNPENSSTFVRKGMFVQCARGSYGEVLFIGLKEGEHEDSNGG